VMAGTVLHRTRVLLTIWLVCVRGWKENADGAEAGAAADAAALLRDDETASRI